MNRRWLLVGVGVIIGSLLVSAATAPTTGAPTARPSQVEVVNFPNPQNVAGAVSVDNFPATQTVAGGVNVLNLPAVQNVAGAVEVSNLPRAVRFVGFTQANLDWLVGVFEASRACIAEFPESRVCEYTELLGSIPPPPAFPTPDAALITFRVTPDGDTFDLLDIRCVRGNGTAVPGGCGSIGIYTAPVACCGF